MTDIISDLILDLKNKLGVTAIAVTHDMKSAYKIADRIAMLYEGRVLEIAPPEEIKHSKHPHVHQFVEGLSHGPIQMKVKEYD
jgi:phospholipid/cholesterol/gamma-HCH transport system ATP-binding protein